MVKKVVGGEKWASEMSLLDDKCPMVVVLGNFGLAIWSEIM